MDASWKPRPSVVGASLKGTRGFPTRVTFRLVSFFAKRLGQPALEWVA
jgi:hypothetical protein